MIRRRRLLAMLVVAVTAPILGPIADFSGAKKRFLFFFTAMACLFTAGLFFAPELSTSNRATVGGMINTDASGQGSCTYGKTRDHVLELEMILRGGERLRGLPLAEDELDSVVAIHSG